jgi:tRNA A58 N-methylase Trm61
MNIKSITSIVHDAVRSVVGPGDNVVDATVGNGHDTLFLAGLVGPEGRVTGFDVQQAAVDSTRVRLESAGVAERVRLVRASHHELGRHCEGPLRCVMFNLGYLPGSDKSVITTPGTTIQALDQALELLGPGGLVTIVLYPGHVGGVDEARAVLDYLEGVESGYTCARYELLYRSRPAPIALFVSRVN